PTAQIYTLSLHDALPICTRINIHAQDKPFREVLDESFKNQPFTYEIESNTVIVSPKRETNVVQRASTQREFRGRVLDSEGNPLADRKSTRLNSSHVKISY